MQNNLCTKLLTAALAKEIKQPIFHQQCPAHTNILFSQKEREGRSPSGTDKGTVIKLYFQTKRGKGWGGTKQYIKCTPFLLLKKLKENIIYLFKYSHISWRTPNSIISWRVILVAARRRTKWLGWQMSEDFSMYIHLYILNLEPI